ncbi:hypothetical protein ERJ75_001714700 [Trypanosoma vivax]|nr:hypothetical protein ERJ75_001714700 [Trypanosoma vivax]
MGETGARETERKLIARPVWSAGKSAGFCIVFALARESADNWERGFAWRFCAVGGHEKDRQGLWRVKGGFVFAGKRSGERSMERRGESRGRDCWRCFWNVQSGNAMEAVERVVEGRGLASHDSKEDRGVEGDSVNGLGCARREKAANGMVLCSDVSAAVRDGTAE